MTSKDLFKEMNNIDDSLIEEASDFVGEAKEAGIGEQKTKRKKFFTKSNIFRIAGVAAAACLMVCVGWYAKMNNMEIGYIVEKYSGEDETVLHDIGFATENETGLIWYRTDELVYFGGHMYRTYLHGSGVTDQTIEETFFKKGELLGKVEDSKQYGESIYKGCPIYSIEGRKGTRQILVEHEGELLLFHLHEWLYEPDMKEKFKVYGIETAEDIQSVTVKYGPRDEYGWNINSNVIREQEEINELYNIMLSLILDKEGYNDILTEISNASYKAWKDAGGDEPQTAEDGAVVFTPAYNGTRAFDESVDIVLLSGDNEELTYSYYPKMGYLLQYKATDELISWINKNTK